ncbi:hypothetical protein HAHE_25380 [Haloferula helveola]|uniref:Uncharacterized protein n=1 Tax=Haloferula helveola TaxID=490095 RepID=A0ABM7RDM5_9BACT|nr:hypothetical protein HAHE_25380 [Haloferula helveola]
MSIFLKILLIPLLAGPLLVALRAQDPAGDPRFDPARLDRAGKYPVAIDAEQIPEEFKIEPLGEGKFRLGQITIDVAKRQLTIPVAVAETRADLEYALVHSDGKTHESLLVTDVHPARLHIAALLLFAKPGTPVTAELSWTTNDRKRSIQLPELIGITESGRKPVTWSYQAISMPNGQLAAASELSILPLIHDAAALVAHQLPAGDLRDDIYRAELPESFPAKEQPLSLTLSFAVPKKTRSGELTLSAPTSAE